MVQQLSSLRGSSAEALQALGERVDDDRGTLEEFADARRRPVRRRRRCSAREPALRRAVTDVSTPAEAKAALVAQPLRRQGRRAGARPARRRGRAAAGSSPRDLADALEHLGVVAVVRSAGRRAAGRLADELFAVAQVGRGQPRPARSRSRTRRARSRTSGALLRGLLDGRALPATVALVEQALAGLATARSTRRITSTRRSRRRPTARASPRSASPARSPTPSAPGCSRRSAAQYGRPVHLNVEVDPALLGGMRVEIGDDVIDGTVASRLDDARRKLAG